MEKPRGNLLPDAALSGDQNSGVGTCRALDIDDDIAYSRADADDRRPLTLGHTCASLATTVPLYACGGFAREVSAVSGPLFISSRQRVSSAPVNGYQHDHYAFTSR